MNMPRWWQRFSVWKVDQFQGLEMVEPDQPDTWTRHGKPRQRSSLLCCHPAKQKTKHKPNTISFSLLCYVIFWSILCQALISANNTFAKSKNAAMSLPHSMMTTRRRNGGGGRDIFTGALVPVGPRVQPPLPAHFDWVSASSINVMLLTLSNPLLVPL